MEKEQYMIEREYLGIISVKEMMSRIIKSHSNPNRGYGQSGHEKPIPLQRG